MKIDDDSLFLFPSFELIAAAFSLVRSSLVAVVTRDCFVKGEPSAKEHKGTGSGVFSLSFFVALSSRTVVSFAEFSAGQRFRRKSRPKFSIRFHSHLSRTATHNSCEYFAVSFSFRRNA